MFGTPKTHYRRSVPLPRFLVDPLKNAITGRDRDALVFASPSGEVLRNNDFRRRVFDRAANAIGLTGFTPHELREWRRRNRIAPSGRVIRG